MYILFQVFHKQDFKFTSKELGGKNDLSTILLNLLLYKKKILLFPSGLKIIILCHINMEMTIYIPALYHSFIKFPKA